MRARKVQVVKYEVRMHSGVDWGRVGLRDCGYNVRIACNWKSHRKCVYGTLSGTGSMMTATMSLSCWCHDLKKDGNLSAEMCMKTRNTLV